MKNTLWMLIGTAILATTSGCIVAPARPVMVAAPAQSVYAEPTYASPGVGWAWEFHPAFGWGWHHPQHGWHRGWR
jgi:hypothetical protein